MLCTISKYINSLTTRQCTCKFGDKLSCPGVAHFEVYHESVVFRLVCRICFVIFEQNGTTSNNRQALSYEQGGSTRQWMRMGGITDLFVFHASICQI